MGNPPLCERRGRGNRTLKNAITLNLAAPLRYCPGKKEGGQEGYHSICLDFLHNRRCFLDTLKGLIFCFKLKKLFQCLGPKKCGALFYVTFTTKNSKAHCDVALLLMVVICGVRLIGRLPYHLHLSRPLNLHQIPFTNSATRLTGTNGAPILDVVQQPM